MENVELKMKSGELELGMEDGELRVKGGGCKNKVLCEKPTSGNWVGFFVND